MKYVFCPAVLLAAMASPALAAPSVSAEAPAEVIKAAAPTWCGAVTSDEKTSSKPKLSSEYFDGMQLEDMRDLVLYSCEDPSSAARQAEVQAVRQSVSNSFGLTAADNERLMKLAAKVHGGSSRYRPVDAKDDPACKQLAPLKSGTLQEKMSRALERVAIGCGDWSSADNKSSVPSRYGTDRTPWWIVDAPDGFGSELAESEFVISTLTTFKNHSEQSRKELKYYLPWVNASGVTLDDATFRKQLAAMKLPEEAAMRAIVTFRSAFARFERQRAFIKAETKGNAALTAIFFTGPEAARKAYAKDVATHRAVVDQVLDLEAAQKNTPGGMDGCAAKLFPAFAGWVKDLVKARPKAAAAELYVEDYLGATLVYGLSLCARNDADAPVLDQVIGYFLSRMTPQRGAIAASHVGMLAAYNKADGELSDPGRPTVDAPSLGESMHAPYLSLSPNHAMWGTVASVKAKGATTTITFKKDTRSVATLECEETDHVLVVTAGGNKIRDIRCKKSGERKMSGTPAAITVPTYAAGGIKAGALLKYWGYNGETSAGAGWPVEAFADAKGTKRTNLFGVKL